MELAAHMGHLISGGGQPEASPVLAMVSAAPIVNPAAHFIESGNDSCRLGPGFAPAARAQAMDTKDALDGQAIKDGSTTVLVGADFKQMVRRHDATSCGGKVAEGIDTIFVGG